MKSSMLSKIMWLILLTVILSAVLTALIFNFTGINVFSELKVKEIEPRVKYVAEITRDYMQGEISQASYARAVGTEYRIWDASLYVYDASRHLFVYPKDNDHNDKNIKITQSVLPLILEQGKSFYTSGTFGHADVVLGEPIFDDDGIVIGAAFMVKPIKEVSTALQSLTYALVISMLVVTVIMIIPAYIGSRSLTKPIEQMTRTADAMACGDFSAHADDVGENEIAQLGKALNYLSKALSETIDDLTFERNRLRAVLFGLGEGIIGFDDKGEITQCNPSSIRLLGGETEESLPQLPTYQALKKAICEVLKDGESRSVITESGEATLKCTATALNDDESGRLEGVVTLIQDITEVARLEQTRRDYVANVSHELRTPMASIRSLADALNDGLIKKKEDKSRYYGYILKESIRLSRLIDDLLELSRLQSGSVALSKQKFTLEEMVFDVADRYSTSAKERNQTISVNAPENCPKVFSNPDRAEEVLIALLDNAIKHAPDGGPIEIKVEDKNEKLLISVSNEGEIAKADADHVFERFYKVDRSHSGGGTGLGLAIAKEIMTLLHEDIYVHSSNGNVTFSFTLQKA